MQSEASQSSIAKAHHDALEEALRGVELAGVALVSAPRSSVDLRPIARLLERAATRVLDVYDARAEVGAALDEAAAACDEAGRALLSASATDAGLSPAVTWIEKASAWLRNASDTGARVHRAGLAPRDVTASRDVPTSHVIARATLGPRYDVAAPLPSPPELEAPPDPSLPVPERLAIVRARAEARRVAAAERREEAAREREAARAPRKGEIEAAPPGFVPGRHRPLTNDEVVLERARDCFEDIAAIGVMRVPLLDDPWRSTAVLDARLLSAIDAIAALGERALRHVERLVVDAPAKDPSRAFALALSLGSFEGRDALSAVERGLRALGMDDRAMAKQAAEGLSLAPHPGLLDWMRRWLVDVEPGLRAVAVEVLGRRGALSLDEIERALRDDDVGVIEGALIPAAMARSPDLALRAEELLRHTDEGVSRALAWALVLGEVPFAMTHLAAWLGSAREEAALLPLALAGERDDVERLVELASKRPKRERVVALGWAGAPSAIAVLVRCLRDAKDEALQRAAAYALDRITGARLYEDVLVPPEALDVVEPDDPDDPMASPVVPIARRIGDARDLPAEGSPDRMRLPTVVVSRWEAWLAEHPFEPERRYRRGRLYTPAVSLEEVDREPLVPFERRVLHRELVLKTGRGLPLEPHGFVATQEAEIAAWAEPANKASSIPGAWGRVRRR